MIIRELVTKLSYAIDNSGLRAYQAQAQQLAQQVRRTVTQNSQIQSSDKKKQAKAELDAMFANAKRDHQFRNARYRQNLADIRAESKAQAKAMRERIANEKKLQRLRDTRFDRGMRTASGLASSTRNFGLGLGMLSAPVIATEIAGATKGFSELIKIRRAQASYGAMFNDRQEGNKFQKRIYQFAKETPLNTEYTDPVAMRLLPYFDNNQDKVLQEMRNMGDVVLGDNDKFSRLANQYADAQGRGKVMWEDLKFMSQVAPVLKYMAKLYTGGNVGALMEMTKRGTLTPEMLSKTFEYMTSSGEAYHDAMKLQMGELGGMVDMAKGSWAMMLATMASDWEETAKDLTQSVSKFADYVTNMKTEIRKPVTGGLVGGALAVGALSLFMLVVNTIVNGFINIAKVVRFIPTLVAWLGRLKNVISAVIWSLRFVFSGTLTALGSLFSELIVPIALVVGAIYFLWKALEKAGKWLDDHGLGLKGLGEVGSKRKNLDARVMAPNYLYAGYTMNQDGEFTYGGFPWANKITPAKELNLKVDATVQVPEGTSAQQEAYLKQLVKVGYSETLMAQFYGLQTDTVGVK